MPRVCLIVLIALIGAQPARAAEERRYLGLYTARTAAATTASAAPALTAVPVVASTITATAHGPLIEVVTVQKFTNTTKDTIEAVYVMPLPPDAAVSAMAIQVGGKVIRAEIAARDQAAARHEAAVAAGVVGALLEQDRPDVFTQTITGIAPGATVEVELRWDALAARRDGAWELVVPLVVAPRAAPGTATGRGTVGTGTSPDTDRSPDASRVTPPTRDDGRGTDTTFALALDERATDVTSPSHELAVKTTAEGTRITTSDDTSARDLIVRWKTKPRPRGWIERDAAGGFAAVTVEAPAAAKGKAKPVRAVIVVDDDGAAGTEAALIGHRIERGVIAALGKRDRFAVRDRAGLAWQARGASATDSAAAAGARRDLVALLGQVERLLAAEEQGGAAAQVVLVTDALVADQAAVITAAREVGAAIHVIGVGSAPNRSLCAAIAAATGGVARFADAEDPTGIAGRVVDDLRHPTAAPAIEWGGLEVVDVVPAVLPRLGAGQAVTVLARTPAAVGKTAARAKVSGGAGAGGGAFGFEVEATPAMRRGATSGHGVVGRLWARARLGELVASQAAAPDVAALALRYGLVSPYTAMIAVGEQVVERGGTRKSITVPVAVPSGMRWQVRFRDELDARGRGDDKVREVDGIRGGAEQRPEAPSEDSKTESTSTAATTPSTGATVPTAPPAPTDVVPGRHALDVDSDGVDDEAEEGIGGESVDVEKTSGDTLGSAPASAELMVAGTAARSAPGRFSLSMRAGGGVAFGGGERDGMGALGAGLGVGLGNRLVLGAEVSFWIIGGGPDYATRALATAGVGGLLGGWIDLQLGAGLHVDIADDDTRAGIGYTIGARLGRSWIGPYLRFDGALVPGAGPDDDVRSSGALDLGIELEF
jgi:Ca-activated chloride channel family protein